MKTYYYRLDAIKFFCIIAVVLIHVTGFLPSNGLATMSNYYVYRYLLDIAVPFFFAASGFFISSKTGTEYIGKYAKKIFIMYVAFSFFYIISNVFFIFTDRLILKTSFWGALGNLKATLTIPNMINGTIGSFHLWFLSALFISSLLLYLCVHFSLRPKVIFLLALIVYLSYLIGFSHSEIAKYGGFPKGFFFLAMGYYVGKQKLTIPYPWLWFLASVILLNLFSIYQATGMAWLFLVLSSYFLLIYSVSIPGKKSVLSTLGGSTLSIYILHIFVLTSINKVYTYMGVNEYYNHSSYLILTILLCTFLPVLLYKPLDKWLLSPFSRIIQNVIN